MQLNNVILLLAFALSAALCLLLFIPKIQQDKVAGKGHIVRTWQKDPFQWIRRQLYNCKTDKKACTHLKVDVYNVY